ncbi:hypothetical protein BST61_g9699 [Cercospora zeina]
MQVQAQVPHPRSTFYDPLNPLFSRYAPAGNIRNVSIYASGIVISWQNSFHETGKYAGKGSSSRGLRALSAAMKSSSQRCTSLYLKSVTLINARPLSILPK